MRSRRGAVWSRKGLAPRREEGRAQRTVAHGNEASQNHDDKEERAERREQSAERRDKRREERREKRYSIMLSAQYSTLSTQ